MALTTVPASLSATALTLTTAAQPNITSVGTLTGLTVSGNIAGTLTTAAQTNITSVGTLTALTVSGDAVFTPDNDGVRITGANYATLRLEENDTTNLNTSLFNSSGDFVITTSSDDRSSTTDRFRLDHATGDIGFYNAAGNTQDFFWDASTERLGIGTTSPQEILHVYTAGNSRVEAESTTGVAAFKATNNSGSYAWYVDNTADKFHLYDFTDSAQRVTIDGSGNVGIATTDAKEKLSVSGAAVFDGNHATGTNAYSAAQGVMIHAASSTGFVTAVSNGANDVDLQLRALNGGAANSNQLVLDSEGGVGIGTSSIATNTKLHVKAGTNINFEVENSSSTLRLSALNDARSANVPMEFASSLFRFVTGGVAIGVSNPDIFQAGARELVVGGSGSHGITISSGTSNSGNLFFADGTSGNTMYRGYVQYQHNVDRLALGAASDDRVFITSTGLGINCNPTHFLHVNGGTTNTVALFESSDSGAAIAFKDGFTTTSPEVDARTNDLVFNTGGAEVMRIRSSAEIDITQNSNAVGTFADNIGEVGSGNFCLQVANSAGSALKPLGFRAEDIRFATGSSERMRIDQDGAVTKPYQPAFHARTQSNNNSMPVNTNHSMINSVELFDQGGDYNTSTYKFTAPVTGKYQLNCHMRWNNLDRDANYYILYLSTSNRDYYFIIDPDAFDIDPNYYSMAFGVLADMDANDVSFISLYQDGGAQVTTYDGGSGSNGFSGYLVA